MSTRSAELVRPCVARMAAYVPGEQPSEPGYIKLNTNENPYPPSPLVLSRLHAACDERLRLYPDPAATGVRHKLAMLFGVSPEQTIVGNGSDELLGLVMRTFVDPGQCVAYPYPTYSYYRQLVETQGGRVVTVDFADDYALPAGLPVEGARVTLLANPNAPSGTMLTLDQVDALASRTSGILVVDEAYVDFAVGGCVPLLAAHPHVVLLRTMSKSFSLAGMRIGFGFAAPEIIAAMWKVKDHYNVGRLSLVAAEAALDDIETMQEQAARVCTTREGLTRELRRLGFFVWDSASNFVLARLAAPPAAELYSELKKRRILVRYFAETRLADCLRISVGTDAETARLIAELNDILGRA